MFYSLLLCLSLSAGVATRRATDIYSNLRVAQNGRLVINPVYPGGGTMVAQIFDFRLSESLKMHSSRPFALPNYPGRKLNFALPL